MEWIISADHDPINCNAPLINFSFLAYIIIIKIIYDKGKVNYPFQ